jgi:DNA-binding Lrp family transcriptional regulator
MEILAKLFGGVAKVKLMRLFLFNPETQYSSKSIALRAKISSREVKRETDALVTLGVIRKRQATVHTVSHQAKKSKKIRKAKKTETVFGLNTKFAYLQALKNLLITVSLNADDALVKKFARIGKIKFFLASGVFLQQWDSRVDLLVVGDGMNMAQMEKIISGIEAEVGKEISYSAFETEDFLYRLGIHDRLIRDILDFPHVTLVNRLGIEP